MENDNSKHFGIKILKILTVVFLVLLSSCEKNSQEPKIEYLDLQWIWLGVNNTYDCADVLSCDEAEHPGIHRYAYVYYRGDRPESPSSFFADSVNWVTYWSYKSKWVYYYNDEDYIEFEEIGEDELESKDVSSYLIEYKER
jgi:hypothetical protein|tara:strand:+ start:131 stop:553 length:423 start_codon:yes stop_codon:yes gene_type:complete